MSSGKKSSAKKSGKGTTTVNRYLFYYNLLQFLGWSYVFGQIVYYYTTGQYETKGLWNYTKTFVIICQFGSLLEIVHPILGLVKTGVMLTVAQVLFRLGNIFGVLEIMPPHLNTTGVIMTLVAWSSAEVIRYLFYVFKENNSSPFFIVWLRYTSFIVLIPLGLSGEIINVLVVQGYAAENNIYSFKLPFTDITVGYRILCVLFIPLLIRGFLMIYSHMFAQRKKVLKSSSE